MKRIRRLCRSVIRPASLDMAKGAECGAGLS